MVTTDLRLAFKNMSQSLGKVLKPGYWRQTGGRQLMASLPLWLKWPSERSKLYHDKVLKVRQPNSSRKETEDHFCLHRGRFSLTELKIILVHKSSKLTLNRRKFCAEVLSHSCDPHSARSKKAGRKHQKDSFARIEINLLHRLSCKLVENSTIYRYYNYNVYNLLR